MIRRSEFSFEFSLLAALSIPDGVIVVVTVAVATVVVTVAVATGVVPVVFVVISSEVIDPVQDILQLSFANNSTDICYFMKTSQSIV